ncbi:hypothetical protein [Venatoribacter cucullus]|uniref:hypothetical protein n=1 Tax=Venatoribacter cucullus TaxID=2661630 RepID=UPI0022409922|nr:hypothetical protein [Venatoribacter cucullus]UZK04450.1 hypothetical protein GAY96_11310 [Venatoribacter cucullus]
MGQNLLAIEPGIGAGPIILGKHRDAIQASYSYVYTSFFKVQTSKFRSDHCDLAGFTAHYDEYGNTKYIEIYNSEHQAIEYEIFAMPARKLTLSKLKNYLISSGISFETEDYGIQAPTIGLSTFNSQLQSGDEIIECFGIFKSRQSV